MTSTVAMHMLWTICGHMTCICSSKLLLVPTSQRNEFNLQGSARPHMSVPKTAQSKSIA